MPFTPVCTLDALLPGRGIAALVGDTPVALFRVGDDVHALDNRDPFSGASVLSRGLVAARGDRRVVVSPLHKQAFDLATGECLDDPSVTVRVLAVRVVEGHVEVSATADVTVAA